MFPEYARRSWRQCLADNYEKHHGVSAPITRDEASVFIAQPRDDPLPTFGAKFVTAPPTPVISSDLVGPDPRFIEELERCLGLIGSDSDPRDQCDLFSESDSDGEDVAPWSSRDYAVRLFKRSGMDLREDSKKDAQPHKRPRRETADCSRATINRRSKQTRHSHKPQDSFSPPQTPSPIEREYKQGGSTSSCECLVAQQPTPEADNSRQLNLQERRVLLTVASAELETPAGWIPTAFDILTKHYEDTGSNRPHFYDTVG
ncbi:hypothetical protein F66182_4769 [Fusarium sp. NRRL 66182]|nr:hypothetical protein F66182_4769 [Fusarium sp. NRRL 66182]